MTELLFREQGYLRETPARVVEVTPEGGVILDRTVFYASSGGQPGDTGVLRRSDGTEVRVAATVHPDGDKLTALHVLADGSPRLLDDEPVVAAIDWERRHRLMRMHTALHLVTVVFPYPITGAAVGEDKGRVDFNMPEPPDDVAALEARLNEMIAVDHEVTYEWITDAEMEANPGLIKSMNVKPPMGQGRVRLVRIGDVDLQPCGGTHVKSTAEIGPLKLGKIEKKGALNRRITVLFA
jgi:misacylated tRNA(Ala) deacylase